MAESTRSSRKRALEIGTAPGGFRERGNLPNDPEQQYYEEARAAHIREVPPASKGLLPTEELPQAPDPKPFALGPLTTGQR